MHYGNYLVNYLSIVIFFHLLKLTYHLVSVICGSCLVFVFHFRSNYSVLVTRFPLSYLIFVISFPLSGFRGFLDYSVFVWFLLLDDHYNRFPLLRYFVFGNRFSTFLFLDFSVSVFVIRFSFVHFCVFVSIVFIIPRVDQTQIQGYYTVNLSNFGKFK